MKVLVIGGGVAGLACAWHLVRSAHAEVTVFEAEDVPFRHASGKNAAIFRPLEESVYLTQMAERSGRLFAELGLEAEVLRPQDLLLTASSEAPLQRLLEVAREVGTVHEILDEKAIVSRCAWLKGGHARHALLLPQAGVIELDSLRDQLTRRTRALGAKLRCDSQVARLLTHQGRISGVELQDGSSVLANHVVLAAGVWGSVLAASAGVHSPQVPYRRHLVQLEIPTGVPEELPTVWDVELGAYFRAEADGVLACPGDETPHPAHPPDADPAVLSQLSQKLDVLCPSLAGYRVKHYWACLRTFTPERVPLLGADPTLPGLHWLAALGGHGMSVGLAAGEIVSEGVLQSPTV